MFPWALSRRGTSSARRRHQLPHALLVGEVLELRALFTLQGNQLFPADSPWNQRINNAPVATNSSTLVASIGVNRSLHPDFGTMYEGALIGIPYNVVSGTQPKIPVVIDAYADESDLLPVPIPAGAVIEGDPLAPEDNDGDRHLIVYDKDNNKVYELFNVSRPAENADNKWHADSEAVWDLTQNSFRTPGDTSADAAGLPILPGLVRVDEVLDQGVINHALRFTVPRSRNAYVFPASHQAGVSDSSLPRMGERFRLKASFDISGYSPANRVILQALKDYGMIVADNGSGWYLSGAPSTRWDDDDLHDLQQIIGNNFEAVNLTPIVTSLDQASGSTAGGTSVTIHGLNYSGNVGQLSVMFGTTPATSVTYLSDNTVVAIAPPRAAGTVHVTVRTPYGTSATVAGDQFTYSAATSASVVGRYLFYNNSKFDGNGTSGGAIGPSDDLAIASDKSALLPGQAATFANISSYNRGLNGIMIDLGGPHGTLSASDFIFRTGSTNAPSSWTTAPAPSAISVRTGAGISGSDRVEIVWASGAIASTWLQVIVKANANTGLAQRAGYPTGQGDVFFFGSLPGDTGEGATNSFAVTDSNDEISARSHTGIGQNVTSLYDFNRDRVVDANDQLISRGNSGVLRKIVVASPPLAPEGDVEARGLAALVDQDSESPSVARSTTTTSAADGNRRQTEVPGVHDLLIADVAARRRGGSLRPRTFDFSSDVELDDSVWLALASADRQRP